MSVIVNHANTFIRNINTANKAASSQNINIIEKYIKEFENINSEYIDSLQLSKPKSYLKILGLSYLVEDTNQLIASEIVIGAIQQMYIFKDIALTLKPCIIKAFFNSDLTIV